MVNPRYRPTIANSRKPIGSKKETGKIKNEKNVLHLHMIKEM